MLILYYCFNNYHCVFFNLYIRIIERIFHVKSFFSDRYYAIYIFIFDYFILCILCFMLVKNIFRIYNNKIHYYIYEI